MTTYKEIQERYVWLDWMKVLSMYCIVLGHFFPCYINSFLYAFSVPSFFFISGYLSKKVNIDSTYIKKLFKSLILPYCATCIIYIVIGVLFKNNQIGGGGYVANRFIACIIGQQDMGLGCGAMWFVYTLFLIKLMFNNINSFVGVLISTFFLIAAIYVSRLNISWSVTNILLAYPFFYLGQLCRQYNNPTVLWLCNNNDKIKLTISILAFASTYLLSLYNGPVYMFMCCYGSYLFLFIIAAIFGIIGMLSISALLAKYKLHFIITVSSGTIVILEFQQYPIQLIVSQMKNYSEAEYLIFAILISAILMVIFHPIIILIKQYCPILIGR